LFRVDVIPDQFLQLVFKQAIFMQFPDSDIRKQFAVNFPGCGVWRRNADCFVPFLVLIGKAENPAVGFLVESGFICGHETNLPFFHEAAVKGTI
jgi:hypothetical protein